MKTAHHMILYGCKSPGRKEAIFNCGAMAVKDNQYSTSLQPCGSGLLHKSVISGGKNGTSW